MLHKSIIVEFLSSPWLGGAQLAFCRCLLLTTVATTAELELIHYPLSVMKVMGFL